MNASTRWVTMVMPLFLLGSPHASADPLDADTTAKEAAYASPFDGYVIDEDFEAGDWAAANERVGEIGGWRTYLRQAQEPTKDSNSLSDDPNSMMHSRHGSSETATQGIK